MYIHILLLRIQAPREMGIYIISQQILNVSLPNLKGIMFV